MAGEEGRGGIDRCHGIRSHDGRHKQSLWEDAGSVDRGEDGRCRVDSDCHGRLSRVLSATENTCGCGILEPRKSRVLVEERRHRSSARLRLLQRVNYGNCLEDGACFHWYNRVSIYPPDGLAGYSSRRIHVHTNSLTCRKRRYGVCTRRCHSTRYNCTFGVPENHQRPIARHVPGRVLPTNRRTRPLPPPHGAPSSRQGDAAPADEVQHLTPF